MRDELKHYGIHGQKWGVRRWQNEDGSFNDAGKIRYGRVTKFVSGKQAKQISREENNLKNKYYEEAVKQRAKSDPQLAKVVKLRERAGNLAIKYHLDLDDGGGNHTPEGEKAGREYMKLQRQIYNLEESINFDDIYRTAKNKTNNALVKKYGKSTIDAYNRHKSLVNGMVSTGVALVSIGSLVLTAKVVNTVAKKGTEMLFKGLGKGIVGIYNVVNGTNIKIK